jgi:hypothetical protein
LCYAEANFHFLTYLMTMALRPAKNEKGICVDTMHCILQHSFVKGRPEGPYCSSPLSSSFTSDSELETSSFSMLSMMASLDLAAT